MKMSEQLDVSSGYIEGREHNYLVRIFYEDTDFSGVVYYANYLRFLERGRSSFFRMIGIKHAQLLESESPTAFAIRKLNLDYIRAARIDDVLRVVTRYDRFKGPRLYVSHKIFRGEELILTAEAEAVCIDMQGKPKRPSKEMLAKLTPYFEI